MGKKHFEKPFETTPLNRLVARPHRLGAVTWIWHQWRDSLTSSASWGSQQKPLNGFVWKWDNYMILYGIPPNGYTHIYIYSSGNWWETLGFGGPPLSDRPKFCPRKPDLFCFRGLRSGDGFVETNLKPKAGKSTHACWAKFMFSPAEHGEICYSWASMTLNDFFDSHNLVSQGKLQVCF